MTRRIGLIGLVALAAASALLAQDQQRVTSPDGRIEFRIFIDKPDAASLFRLAYQVSVQQKPLIRTSFLGLLIHNQEPALGENVGLTSSKTVRSGQYNTLVAEYLQNGSLGRRINVEARAYNDGVAFRYVLPASTPLIPMLLDDEETEFELAANTEKISGIAPGSRVSLPFVTEQPGIGWVAIDEIPSGSYPRMSLTRQEGTILVSRLPSRADESGLAWEGTTPMTGPWRVITIGATRQDAAESKIVNSLK